MSGMKAIVTVIAASAVVALAGCQRQADRAAQVDAFFPADDAARPIWRAMEAQASAGAAQDGMLFPQHFAGVELNDLGRDRLDLMLRADARPVVVYLAVADDDALGARAESVQRFLQGAGLGADAIDLRSGPNPAARGPAAPGLARLAKTENPGGAANPGDSRGSGGTTAVSTGATGSR